MRPIKIRVINQHSGLLLQRKVFFTETKQNFYQIFGFLSNKQKKEIILEMSRQSNRAGDPRKVNGELFTLTYGALVAQLVKDYENDEDVNRQLEKMGYNMGIRLIEDFLARSNVGRCHDFRETADVISKAGFRMYLGITPVVSNWSPAGDEFSLLIENNPLTEFVELPEGHNALNYSNILCGALKGCLEMVQMDVDVRIVQDQLKGDSITEIRLKFIKRLEDALPAGED